MCGILSSNYPMAHFSLHSLLALILVSFYAISLLISSATANIPALQNKTTTDPRLTLLSFKSLLSDPLRSLASWDTNGSLHYCMWRGITCGRRHPLHVVALDLNSLRLAGPISPIISNLTFLKRLHLQDNQLHGSIPEELGRLSRLQYLNLSANNLQGEIPATLSHCSYLQELSLRFNRLSGVIPSNLTRCFNLRLLSLVNNMLAGEIPSDIGSLSMLETLNLKSNNLNGRIPPLLGNLSSLLYLNIGINNLEGSIPKSLGSIPGLQMLNLNENNLSGRIPSSIYNLSTITDLWLGYNRLSGRLSPDMGLTLPNLKNLVLQTNQFEGRIPVSLSNVSEFEKLALDNNSFIGPLPSNLRSLQNLSLLSMASNQLQANDWSFLSSLTNCTLLDTLALHDNNLEGPLPSSVGNLSKRLTWLSIGKNPISGIIPSEIGNLVNLEVLFMDQSLLVGNIPASIGQLRNLSILGLFENNLSGSIPSAIGNLNQLTELSMGENNLSGTIPASIGGCTSLALLDLSHNLLEGTIPRELVSLSSLTIQLNLSYNSLSGSIPMEVAHLINLGILAVSENQLSGDIPPTLGSCQVLEQLHMEGNFFQGNIPPSFIRLKGLEELDLSRNNFSGRIPEFFKSFQSLQSLNLSFNDFEGEVPSGNVFNNASEFSVLGNKKLCGGYPKLKLPSCSSNVPKRQISHLKVIIPVVSAAIILLLSLSGFLFMRRKAVLRGPSPASSFEGEKYRKVSYADIHKATDGFSSANLVGAGSFGSVYKGKIDCEESVVAIKVLNLYRKGSSKSFTAECETLRNIRHRNLIKIITACSSVDHRGNDFKALVYEYMPNGSLEKWLHPEIGLEHSQPRKLSLVQRLNIAIDVASALDYLHHSCQPPVVHRDLKPSNILLNNDMMARVGDFGLSKLLSESISTTSKNSTSSIGIKGSVGYIAPEYGNGGQVSTHGDVYSFGILLLEMITGKKPTDEMFKDGLNLRRYVEMGFIQDDMEFLDQQLVSRDEGEATNIMNESITGERSRRCIFSLVRIGLLCSNDAPGERMRMKDVATEFRTIKVLFSMVEAHGGGKTI